MTSNTLTEFTENLPFKLDDYQLDSANIIDSIKSKANILITLPTGAGKTVIAEYAIWKAFKNGNRTIYTNPLKALSTEKLNTWQSNYLSDLTIMKDTSDDVLERTETNYQNYDVLITTNERLNSILRKKRQVDMIFKDVEYIIIDEIHLLGSKGRGTTLEYIIMVVRELMSHIKIIGLSATLPNYKQFAGWLSADYIYLPPDKRPVPLEHKFCEPIEEAGSKAAETQMKFFILRNLVMTHRSDQFIVFVSSRLRAEQLAKQLSNINPRDNVSIKKLISTRNAYHHAGLDGEERTLVETQFIKGRIKVLFATPTLAQGINLPAKNIVMFDLKRWSIFKGDHEFIEHYEVKQMSGRAGRRGYDTYGRCFYLGTLDEILYAEQSVKYPADMRSRIYESLDDHILALSVSGIVKTRDDIERIFSKSFFTYQSPQASFLIKDETEYLLHFNFLDKSVSDPDVILPTRYGNLSSKLYVKPRTVNEIYQNVIYDVELASKMGEMDIIKSFLRVGEFLLSIRVGNTDHRYLTLSRRILNPENLPNRDENIECIIYNPDKNEYEKINLTQNYMKALGLVFAEDLGVKVIGSKKELYSIRKTASEMIKKAHIVLKTREEYRNLFVGNEHKILIASKMVEYGKVNPKDVHILLIDGIGEKRYEKLIKAGIKTLPDFMVASEGKLSSILRLSSENILKMKAKTMKEIPIEQICKDDLIIT